MMYCQLAVAISDASLIGDVRRHAQRIGNAVGLNEADCGRASIIATELATNISRYATGGEILMRTYAVGDSTGVEIVAIDRGPGLESVSKSLEDGFSTGGTAGHGLGAVQRLSSEFDIYSAEPSGTVVFSRIQASSISVRPVDFFTWGAVNRPAPHEQLSGDVWRISQRGSEVAVLIADGLGHGPIAAEAAETAATNFDEDPFTDAIEFFARADRRMRGTRGAAVALAQIDIRKQSLIYTGVGNIAGSFRSPGALTATGLMSHNGTVGGEMRKVVSVGHEFCDQALLIMHSDGLQTRWSLDSYPGLTTRHPAIVAAVLYRDFCRARDDITVVAVRLSSAAKTNGEATF